MHEAEKPPHADRAGYVDTLIVGAGLSGIGVACHLRRDRPRHSYTILEGRGDLGGTWDLFRYPGVRSDSDLHTLGYAFKPWTGEKVIASGQAIQDYIRETAGQHGVLPHIRFGHKVIRADWSGAEGLWTVEARRTDGEHVLHTCRFLVVSTGYYDYDAGHLPDFPGQDRFKGTFLHPQHWPRDFDHTGRRVVVIGSGATGVTLVPALADRARHVTLLQRSPSYVLPVASKDALADAMRRLLGDRLAHRLTRRKNIAAQTFVYRLSRRHPRIVKKLLRTLQRRLLPQGYDIGTHFGPRYEPWDQRLCVVPDGDLFKAISSGRASVVTDRIAAFAEEGIQLASGALLEADTVVTATGLNLLAFGGMRLEVDGTPVSLPDTRVYKGCMLSGVPNLAFTVGYINASWTLKVDLVCAYLCRLLNRMDATGRWTCVPHHDGGDAGTRPLMDFAAGYVQRSIDAFPRQGDAGPWRMNMSYKEDVRELRHGRIEDGVLRFGNPTERTATPEPMSSADPTGPTEP
ncbi:NAD(P)/FAD-dependent oxidoreductase [Streptomyces sp. NPDC001228]|uniref:flavin-containing monooxygenase n=1 Tax=Streptomyces sp. NPDC001228 TaxID=3154381 RepID=UPI00332653BD